jgi:4-amino-4-deoxy-L-arabinose transferase-like glycosyltransferase
MLQSWHNFFFNAFDPTGFLSLDKPPLAFWLQTASAHVFGFNRLAVLMPQFAEGVGSVALLYWLVRRRFGVIAGLLAALFLALTPIAVAVDRSNNTESLLVLVLLLAAWAMVCAVETGRLPPLLAAAALVGIGFNVKMLVAFGVVPAFALVYVLGNSLPVAQRIRRLAAAGVVLLPVALSWSLVYELTPAQDRPFVDSTQDHSMLELAVGHNFLQRFVRRADSRPRTAPPTASSQPAGLRAGRDYVPAGPLRLAGPPLAADLLWLFPLALIGGIAAWRRSEGLRRRELAIWAVWTAAYGIVFSAAGGIFHSYYLAVMAPALRALAAIGTTALWELYETGRWGSLMLMVAILSTGLWQAHVIEGLYTAGSIE